LPSLVVFLDRGVLMNARIADAATPDEPPCFVFMNLVPQFSSPGNGEHDSWVFAQVGPNEKREASALAFLVMKLVNHLQDCLLMPPKLSQYFSTMLTLAHAEEPI